MQTLGLPSLKSERIRGDLIQMYKIFHDINDMDKNKFFALLSYDNTRNSVGKIFIKYSRTNLRKNVFTNRTAPFWNALPVTLKEAPSLNKFKSLLEGDTKLKQLKYAYDA